MSGKNACCSGGVALYQNNSESYFPIEIDSLISFLGFIAFALSICEVFSVFRYLMRTYEC